MADVTSMDTRIFCRDDSSEPKYEVSFETHNRAFYEKVVAVCRECIDNKEKLKKDIFTEIKETPSGKKHDNTFDIVDAFMHLIWGRKVRMTHWDEDEYIVLKDCNLQIGEKWIIRNDDKLYPAEKLFDKDNIEAIWEDYKEE